MTLNSKSKETICDGIESEESNMCQDCQFCKYAVERTGVTILLENEEMMIIDNDRPYQEDEPMHLLAFSKRHVSGASPLATNDAELLGRMLMTISQFCFDLGLAEDGATVRSMICKDRAEEKAHLHIHVLSPKSLKEILSAAK